MTGRSWWRSRCDAGREASAESDDVGAGGCEHVLDMRLCQAAVAAVAQAMSVDRFRDSGLAACPDGIAPLPVTGLLVFPDLGLDLLLGLGQQEGERQQTAGEFPSLGRSSGPRTVLKIRIGASCGIEPLLGEPWGNLTPGPRLANGP